MNIAVQVCIAVENEGAHIFLSHGLEIVRILVAALVRRADDATVDSRLSAHRVMRVLALVETTLLILAPNASIL